MVRDLESVELIDTMKRQESILVLAHNTLRFIDVAIQQDLYNISNIKNDLTIEQMTYKLLCRSEKSLAKINKVDPNLLDAFVKKNYAKYYIFSPRTNLYDILNILVRQKFVDNATVLFKDKLLKEDDEIFTNAYYDGSYEELVKFLQTSKFTCLIIDDVELLNKLTLEESLNFDNKTIIISRIGYNYYKDKVSEMLLLKNYDEISKRIFADIYTLNLFEFSESAQWEKK